MRKPGFQTHRLTEVKQRAQGHTISAKTRVPETRRSDSRQGDPHTVLNTADPAAAPSTAFSVRGGGGVGGWVTAWTVQVLGLRSANKSKARDLVPGKAF